MKKWPLLFACLLFYSPLIKAQIFDLVLPKGVKHIDVPFEYENDFIIVKVLFNGSLPLRFIFDTGAEHTILTKRAVTDLFQIQYDRRFTIYGSDLSTMLYAYLARGITLKLDKLVATNRNILVLEEDYFRFQEFAGVNVQGILGSDLFRRFVVKIDFQRQLISFIDPSVFNPPKKFKELAIDLYRSKPYLNTKISVNSSAESSSARLLIDTGASLSLLLYTNTDINIELPPKTILTNIGMGLGGFLQGAMGRIEKIEFDPFAFSGVITNFQELDVKLDSLNPSRGRHGILGNHILKRFTVYIDYIEEKMYLKPSRNYRSKFAYDRSGLNLSASGAGLNTFSVFNVVPNSPAGEVGLQKGDQIKRVNGWPVIFFSLEELTRKLRARKGKKITLVVEREGETLKFEFRLRELI